MYYNVSNYLLQLIFFDFMQASTQPASPGVSPSPKKRPTLGRILTPILLLLSISAAMAIYTAMCLDRQHRMPTFTQTAPPTSKVQRMDGMYLVTQRLLSFDRDSSNNDLVLFLEDGSHQVAGQISKEQIRYMKSVYWDKDWYFDKKNHTVITRDKD